MHHTQNHPKQPTEQPIRIRDSLFEALSWIKASLWETWSCNVYQSVDSECKSSHVLQLLEVCIFASL